MQLPAGLIHQEYILEVNTKCCVCLLLGVSGGSADCSWVFLWMSIFFSLFNV